LDESFKKASIEDIEFGRELISSGHRFILDKIEWRRARKKVYA
jgi:hypothetical protein